MGKIAVVGCSGSGKTALARQLADRRGLEHIELDALAQLPGWTLRPADELRSDLEARLLAAQGGWVSDGNYESMVGDAHLNQADTIVWLDLPRRIVMTRVVWRTIRRVLTREELWNGNKEPLTNLYRWDPELNIIRWTWVTHPECREKYGRASYDGSWVHAEVIRLRSPEAAEDFLGSTAVS